MNIEHILGIGFLVLGLVSMSSYTDSLGGFRLPLFYKELKPMQERWGMLTGTLLHILEYVVIPVGFGLLFILGLVAFH